MKKILSRKTVKRTWSILLTIIMIVTLVPNSLFVHAETGATTTNEGANAELLAATPVITKITDGYRMVNDYFIVETGKYGQITTLQLQGDEFPTNYVMNIKNSPSQNTAGHQWLGEVMFQAKLGNATKYTEQNTSRSDSVRKVELKDNKIAITYENATEAKGIKDFKVVETYSLVGDKLRFEITVTNTKTQNLTIGDFGLPMPFNERWPGGEEIYETRTVDHGFVGLNSSYLYASRPSGLGRFLLMTPDITTNAGFEYKDHWRTQERAADEAEWCQDQAGFASGLNVYYIHSDNIKKTNRGYLTNTKLELAPGQSKTYAFQFTGVKDENHMKSTLYNDKVIDAVAVPGMTYSVNMPGKVYLHTPLPKEDISFTIKCPHEMNIFTGTNIVSNLLPCKKTSENTYIKYNKTEIVSGEQYHVYDIKFADLGQNNIEVTYNGGKSKTVLQFYMMDDVATALTTHSDFIVEKTQFNTPLQVSDKVFDDWMMDSKKKRAETDPTYWQKNYWGWGDDWALTHGQYIAEKNVYQPVTKEIKAVDEYLDIAIWNGLMREHQKDYLVHDFLMESPNSSPTYRGYAYPHIYNTYFSMYKIAVKYPNMISYEEEANTYLLRAFNILKALYGSTVSYNWSTGLMGELTTPDIIAALEKEGYYGEATEIKDIMLKKYNNFKNSKYPYGSEYSYDNTGEEAVYTLAKLNLGTDKANANTMMDKIDLKTRACRGLQPIWYYYANPTTICGDSWWQFQYTAALAGYCMDDWLRLEDNGMTATQRATASRVNYAAKLANLTAINSGQIDADPSNIGAVAWTYQSELGNLGGQGTGGGNLHNGWRQMSGESDLGLFGALQILSSDVVIDPVFGLFGYGCKVSEESGVYTVTPLDGLFTRLNFINQDLYIELDRDQYTSAKVKADNTSIELSMKNLERTAHNTNVDITGLKSGSYQILVNGTLTGSFQAVADKTSTITLALPAAQTAEISIKAGTALANKAPIVSLAESKTVALSDKVRLEATAIDDGYINSTLTYSWKSISVPVNGVATIATSTKNITNVTFSKSGDYVFEFTANDGALSTSKRITVRVTENPILPQVVAHYTFDEATIIGTNKLLAKSISGTLQAEVDDNSVLVTGKDGKGIQYAGSISKGYIELPEELTKNLTNATISIDVNLTDAQANKTTLFELGDKVVVEFINGNIVSMTINGKQVSTNVELAPGFWKNVELTASGDDYILYINGAKKAELQNTGLVLADIDTTKERYLIGRSKVESDPFLKGVVDNFIARSYVMTEQELKAAFGGIEHKPLSAKTTTIVTSVGKAPVLPTKVSVLFTDGVYELSDVTWNAVPSGNYAVAGTFTVNGFLKDANISVSINVIVVSGSLQNVAGEATPSAIYNNPSDLGGVKGLNDGFDPTRSSDTSKGAWHNWGGNNGAPAWVQYNWSEQQIITSMDMYFFRDGNGNFMPANYAIEYLNEEGKWVSVTNAVGLGVSINQYNKTTFDAIVTKAIKVIMNPQTQGCGVLEWKVYAYKQGSVVDKSALNAAITNAEGLKDSLFTAGVTEMKSALATAKVVVADRNSTQQAINSAAAALNTAIISMKPIGNNMAYSASADATYTSSWEKLSAVNDGAISSVSNSSECSHWGTWGHADVTSETVTYTWGLPIKLSSAELYIWNDGGGIYTPVSYRYEYLDSSGSWKAVSNARGYGIALDGFNITTFDQVLTKAIRVTMMKESSDSGVGLGLVEWRVIGGKDQTTQQQTQQVIISTDPADTSAVANDGIVAVTLSSTVTGPAITVTGAAIMIAELDDVLQESTQPAIYYTLDGSEPSNNSILYTGEFVISTDKEDGETKIIRAISTQDGLLYTDVAIKTIVFKPSKSDITPTVKPTDIPTDIPTTPTDTPTNTPTDSPTVAPTETPATPTPTLTPTLTPSPTPSPTPTLSPTSVPVTNTDYPVAPTPTVIDIIGDSDTISTSLRVDIGNDSMDILVQFKEEDLKKQLNDKIAGKIIELPIITQDLIKQSVNKSIAKVNISIILPEEIRKSSNIDGLNIKLTKELLQAAKENKMDVTVTVKDEAGNELYSWSFLSKDLESSKKSLTDVNTLITVSKIEDQSNVTELLATTKEEKNGLLISFNHEGVLPAQSKVKLYVGDLIGKGTNPVYLYHYNKNTNKLEALPHSSDYQVDPRGYIEVSLLHCSEYVLLTSPANSKVIMPLLEQITVSNNRDKLYIGGNTQAQLSLNLPSTLEVVSSLNNKTSNESLGAVTVSYKSSNNKVIAVNSKGKITAVGAGTAYVHTTLKLYNNESKVIKTKVTVKKPSIQFTKSNTEMKLGSNFTFAITAEGLDLSKAVWSTSRHSIVTINKYGKATAASKGADYVIVRIGSITHKVKVVVK